LNFSASVLQIFLICAATSVVMVLSIGLADALTNAPATTLREPGWVLRNPVGSPGWIAAVAEEAGFSFLGWFVLSLLVWGGISALAPASQFPASLLWSGVGFSALFAAMVLMMALLGITNHETRSPNLMSLAGWNEAAMQWGKIVPVALFAGTVLSFTVWCLRDDKSFGVCMSSRSSGGN
jgi:hypothetical protein